MWHPIKLPHYNSQLTDSFTTIIKTTRISPSSRWDDSCCISVMCCDNYSSWWRHCQSCDVNIKLLNASLLPAEISIKVSPHWNICLASMVVFIVLNRISRELWFKTHRWETCAERTSILVYPMSSCWTKFYFLSSQYHRHFHERRTVLSNQITITTLI